jgi:hypothetical protein
MGSRRASRTRLAIVLALSALMWSDSALAALICSQRMGCHATSSVQGQASLAAEDQSPADDSAVHSMACCPHSDEDAMQCLDPAMGCCTLEQGSSQPAVVDSKSNSRPAKLDVAVSSASAAVTSSAAEQVIHGWHIDTSLYIRPVNQKKTDLRI